MTTTTPHKLRARALSALLLGAGFSVLTLAAPTAVAAEGPKNQDDNTYHSDRNNKKKAQPQTQRRRDWREDKRQGRGDWRGVDERRTDRSDRTRRERTRRDRTRRDYRRDDRNSRNSRWEHRDNYRRDRYRSGRRDTRRRDYYRRNNRRNNYGYSNYGYNNYGHNSYYGNQGYRTNYRSSLGINFVFGNPGYSNHRWASSPYSFYQPGNWSYSNYYNSVSCQRITVQANHHGHSELISVNQCYNPIDGYYIIQGSERIIDCPYG